MPYFLVPANQGPYHSHAQAIQAGREIEVAEAMNRLLSADDSGQGAVTAALGVGRVMLLMENRLLKLDKDNLLLWMPPQHTLNGGEFQDESIAAQQAL